jgi:flagellar basal body L-ring protein FlgH
MDFAKLSARVGYIFESCFDRHVSVVNDTMTIAIEKQAIKSHVAKENISKYTQTLDAVFAKAGASNVLTLEYRVTVKSTTSLRFRVTDRPKSKAVLFLLPK